MHIAGGEFVAVSASLTEGSLGPKISVLAIEDDSAIRHLLRASFQGTDFKLIEAETASEGIEAITRKRPEIVLLDMGLPDNHGLHVIRTVRGWSNLPILVISGHGEEEKKIEALEAGADDYVTKPFGVLELFARMKVALRHASNLAPGTDPVFESGDLRFDRATREVMVRGERVHLTPLEFNLFAALVKHAGKVVTQRQLLTEVWGEEYTEESQYLRVYIGYLRKKIELEPENPTLIVTESRVGYRLVV